uniref:DUF4005 domain-containing protein n=1 Tax=Leersia perrieri TaxID=77586 RepID=A0A0D9V7H1_9ORYZ
MGPTIVGGRWLERQAGRLELGSWRRQLGEEGNTEKMGKKGNWFSAVKKVFSSSDPDGKEAKIEKADKSRSRRKWPFGKSKKSDPSTSTVSGSASIAPPPPPQPQPPPPPPTLPTQPQPEARRALRALRGLVRLKSLVDGNAVKRQTAHTLNCTQTMTRVQTQIYSRRVKMEEEKQALQRQLQLKHQRELEKMKVDEDWDHSHQSKEQWKNSGRTITPTFTDQGNPNWGWSWMERWMTSRPWESRMASDKDPKDVYSTKNHSTSAAHTYVPRAISLQRPGTPNKSSRPPSRQSPSTPPSRAPSVSGKIRPASPRDSWLYKEDDLRSITSIRSERPRRQSTGGASVRDDASLTSTPALPSYMQSTESARAKSRYRSLLTDRFEVPERVPLVHSSIKKRLSFPVAEKPNIDPSDKLKERGRRHSDPPKVDPASLKDVPIALSKSKVDLRQF